MICYHSRLAGRKNQHSTTYEHTAAQEREPRGCQLSLQLSSLPVSHLCSLQGPAQTCHPHHLHRQYQATYTFSYRLQEKIRISARLSSEQLFSDTLHQKSSTGARHSTTRTSSLEVPTLLRLAVYLHISKAFLRNKTRT